MDLISRQAAIDAFYIQSDDDGWWTGTVQDAEELLKGLPSAEPKESLDKIVTRHEEIGYDKGFRDGYAQAITDAEPVRKGRWIAVHDPVFADTYYCSECKKEPNATDTEWILSDFCPNCGADMT